MSPYLTSSITELFSYRDNFWINYESRQLATNVKADLGPLLLGHYVTGKFSHDMAPNIEY